MTTKTKTGEETTEKPDRRETLLEGQELEEATPVAAATETETPEVETPAEPVADETTPETPALSEFMQGARELGYQGDDEQEAAQLLLESYRQVTAQQQAAQQRIAEMEELSRYGTEYLKTQRQQQEPPKVEAEPGKDPWWNPPKFESRWLEQYRDVQVGADNQPVLGWKKNTPREVVEAAEGYQQYLEQWATDLVQRPQEILPKVIEQEFDRLFEERIQKREQAAQLNTFADQVRETNRDWMYGQDSQGREVLTEEGQVMTRLLGEVSESGVTNPQLQWQYAVAMYDYLNRSKQAAATDQTAKTQETAAQKRRQQLARGTAQPLQNRTGSVPRPDEEPVRAQNPHLSPGNQLLDQLRQDGADFI